jgi:hypothetical protein
MFETWTSELKFKAELSSLTKLPALHLDRDVTKNQKFVADIKIEMRQKMNEIYMYAV